ncbi:MAG TPA: amidohydrolase family protein [Casimicrobiaceae bacterium]|nr:amidohydrolase family protein [Casimicrobiaceae bacterium]
MSGAHELVVDCHAHVLDPARFAYADGVWYAPAGQEIAPREQMGAVFAAHGVSHALLVEPNSGYDYDNRCMLDAIARSNGRYKGIAVVRDDASRGELEDLKAAGIVGVAFNVALKGVEFYRGAGPLLERLRDLELWADVQVEHDQLVAVRPLFEASGVRIVFDHGGRPHPPAGPAQPGFAALLSMAATGRAAVKLSGYAKFSRVPHPHEDAWPYMQALLEAYTPRALVWASDWPFLLAPVRVDYGPLIALFARLVPDAAARRAILWDTPRRLFGFGD